MLRRVSVHNCLVKKKCERESTGGEGKRGCWGVLEEGRDRFGCYNSKD